MEASRVWEEVVLLRSTLLPDEFQWRGTADENQTWEDTLTAYQNGEPPALLPAQVHLSLCVSKLLGVWIHAKLDEHQTRPHISVFVQRTDAISQATLADMVRERLDECEAQDLLHPTFDVLSLLQETMPEQVPTLEQASCSDERQANASSLTMKRVIFWSHHLVAPSKRRQFAAWCPELGVWGLLKLGYPGFLCFEGACSDVDDMVWRVKRMQWAAISMRTEVSWTFTRPETTHDTTLDAALRSCALAKGRCMQDKLRTDAMELDSMSDFVARYVFLANAVYGAWN